jgi:hypothetical protein
MKEDKRTKNSSAYWNQDIVDSACKELLSQNITPTVRTVRAHLSITKGSDSTVQKFIRTFHDLKGNKRPLSTPKPLLTALTTLWDQAVNLAKNELLEDQESIHMERKLISDERREIENSIRIKEKEAELFNSIVEKQKSLVEAHEKIILEQSEALTTLTQQQQTKTEELKRSELNFEHSEEMKKDLISQVETLKVLLADKDISGKKLLEAQKALFLAKIQGNIPEKLYKSLEQL